MYNFPERCKSINFAEIGGNAPECTYYYVAHFNSRLKIHILIVACTMTKSVRLVFLKHDINAQLYCIVLYCIVLYCIVLYCIVLYCIVLY